MHVGIMFIAERPTGFQLHKDRCSGGSGEATENRRQVRLHVADLIAGLIKSLTWQNEPDRRRSHAICAAEPRLQLVRAAPDQ